MRLLLAQLLLWALLTGTALAAPMEGRVVGVTDGDTVKVLVDGRTEVTIRLFAIDAPETSCHAWANARADSRCTEKSQPFGKAAKKHLSGLVFGKTVTVRTTGELAQGRVVGTLLVGGQDANYEMVKAGYACHYVHFAKRYQTTDQFQQYAQAEARAREGKLGQWSDARSRCGWDYRDAQRRHNQ